PGEMREGVAVQQQERRALAALDRDNGGAAGLDLAPREALEHGSLLWRLAAAAERRQAVGDGDGDESDDEEADAEDRDGAQIAALVQVVDDDRDQFGVGGGEHDRRRQLADGTDEDEAPGGDDARAQERRGDVAERGEARRAEDAARLLELLMETAKRRLELRS